MPKFEVFKKSAVPLSRQPRITIQKRGTLTINAAAFAALGEPDAVELLYDADEQVLGLRRTTADAAHAAFVRPSSRQRRGPWVISAMAFVHHYEIDTAHARRWAARLEGGVLCIHLDEPNEVVSKRPEAAVVGVEAVRRPRPRPRPS